MALVLGVALLDAGVVTAYVMLKTPAQRATVYTPSAHPTSPWQGTSMPQVIDEDTSTESNPKLPAIKRHVPVFDARVLDGCSKTDLDTVENGIQAAINVGAPLYNDGDFDGCFHTYESTALTLEKKTGSTCKGPARALKSGRDKASKLTSAAEQAWAMRDAFDGLLDVIDRKGPEL